MDSGTSANSRSSVREWKSRRLQILVVALTLFASVFFAGAALAERRAAVYFLIGGAFLLLALAAAIYNRLKTQGRHTTTLVTVSFLVVLGLAVSQVTGNANASIAAPTASRSVSQESLGKIAFYQDQLVPVYGRQADDSISRAQDMQYTPRSGGRLLWESSRVYSYSGYDLVSVPFDGAEDLSITNRLTFFLSKDSIETFEMFIYGIDNTNARVKTWINGVAEIDQPIELPSEASFEHEIAPMGLNWGLFNKCLSGLGISAWALAAIGIVCSAVCAGTAGLGCYGCVGFAAGFTGGSLKTCFQRAWT